MLVSMAHAQSPPHGLALVIDFVNTLDRETGNDGLATPSELAAWIDERELVARGGCPIQSAQLRQALALREALRALMLGHNGIQPGPEAALELEAAARRGRLEVRFAADGSSRLAPSAEGFAGALARLLVPVLGAGADGTWRRVKACRADDCHWAFYDHSRNRSGVWCDMAVCGNRTKVRAYRRRRPAKSLEA
jgi:predicted RNA-binding Zn ribbon-like protein